MEARGLRSSHENVQAGDATANAVIEPRRLMWAVAEVCWADAAGRPLRSRATIVDISTSGACIRLKDRIGVGSRLTIKWRREQFAATARNCRADGQDYLLGVRRDSSTIPESGPEASSAKPVATVEPSASASVPSIATKPTASDGLPAPLLEAAAVLKTLPVRTARRDPETSESKPIGIPYPEPVAAKPPREAAGQERKVMQSKRSFTKFWHGQHEADAPIQVAPKEIPVNKSSTHDVEHVSDPPSHLLSYEDIYHAAGIMNPRSGYGIRKVVEMLNSQRIRDLSKDIQRASVLMALDAAGASVDDLLQDATRRQQALNAYEEGQRKQLEEFEGRKAQENTQIEAEMQRVTSHYAERIQQNKEEVIKHKEALHNWQAAKQSESERISEVIELCGKHPASTGTMAASAGVGTASTSIK
jgi:hypothetical protein